MYDPNNVFAKILRGEIPSKKIIENNHAMAFYNISPFTETHALIIPKGQYVDILDFTKNASPEEQAGFWQLFNETAKTLNISENFNVAANAGADAPLSKQSVFHFHLHLMSGKRLKDRKSDF
jgi:diadenosine tetraphosphate (Ap4A) HIT family hydrolase